MTAALNRESRRYWLAIAAITILAVLRVASTHRVFSAVVDEPAHLAAGYEWLHGAYTIDSAHPPLARILCALPLARVPDPGVRHLVELGNELLYRDHHYARTLAAARRGNLVLLVVAILAIAAWARRAFSAGVAAIAVAIFTALPPILAHAGLITTDLAGAATLPLALFALDLFVERPTLRRTLFLGVAVGLGLLAKFSFLVFFPASAMVWLVAKRSLPSRRIAGAFAIALSIVWAGYRFDVAKPLDRSPDAIFMWDIAAPHALKPMARWIAANVPLPAPRFFNGIALLHVHDVQGHYAVLNGEARMYGWWYYFPVVGFYKTPIPFLLLAAWGIAVFIRERNGKGLAFAGIALAILLVAMSGSINIGVRHILPLYAPLSIVAAYAVVAIWKQARAAFGRTALAALCAWLFIGPALQHPDYLPWFNEAAVSPASIAVDSNLDWGQDVLRLAQTVRERQIESLHVDVLSNARLAEHGISAEPFDSALRTAGWLAISETNLAVKSQFGQYAWLQTYRPVARVGRSIRLYYIP